MKINSDDLYLLGLITCLPVVYLFMKKNIKSSMALPFIASLPVYLISAGSEALFPTAIGSILILQQIERGSIRSFKLGQSAKTNPSVGGTDDPQGESTGECG